jgi:hypothetical protein
MGVAGYYGMALIWKQHDDMRAQTGIEIPFADVNCSRGRAYLLVRSKLVDGRYVLKEEYMELHRKMVSTVLSSHAIKSSRNILASPKHFINMNILKYYRFSGP